MRGHQDGTVTVPSLKLAFVPKALTSSQLAEQVLLGRSVQVKALLCASVDVLSCEWQVVQVQGLALAELRGLLPRMAVGVCPGSRHGR